MHLLKSLQLSQHFIKPRVLAGKYNKHQKWAWIIIISILNYHNVKNQVMVGKSALLIQNTWSSKI